MPALVMPVMDLLVVIVFAAIGRRSHAEGDAVTGVLVTAWPFLTGAVVGWILVLLLRRQIEDGTRLSGGVVVWLSTVAVGMMLRHLTDRGVAMSFIIVSLLFNGALMLGWRAARAAVLRRRREA